MRPMAVAGEGWFDADTCMEWRVAPGRALWVTPGGKWLKQRGPAAVRIRPVDAVAWLIREGLFEQIPDQVLRDTRLT